MAINFTRLATRLGSDVKQLNETNTLNAANRAAFVAALQAHAQALVVEEVLSDRPQTAQDFASCFTEWCRQQVNASESFAAATCTASVSAVGSPVGTPVWVASVLDEFGQSSDFVVPDVLVLQATDGTTVSVMGKAGPPSITDPAWGVGADVNTALTLIDPAADSSASDPDFSSWSTSAPYTPTYWEMAAGTAGVTVSRATDGLFDNTGYCVKFTGDGATTLRLRQDVSALTPGVYAVHVALNAATDTVDTGTITVALRQDDGTLIGSAAISQAFSTLVDDTWTPLGGAVYVPRQIPAGGCYLEIRWLGGSGDELLIDCLSMTPMTRLYTAGLCLTGFQGVTDMTLDTDQWTVTTALSSGTMTGKLAKGIDRLCGIAGLGVRLPTSGSPTQADSLIA